MVYKVRSKILAKGGTQTGANGTHVKKVLAGVVSACVPIVGASAVASGSMAITSASTGDKVFLSGSDADGGVAVYSAVVSADGAITASYLNPTGADTTASTMTFHYLVIGT